MELTIAGVGTRLGGRWVVDGVDATPPTGALTGLLGPNGAGKTTLLRLVAGLLVPQAGAVLVADDETADGIDGARRGADGANRGADGANRGTGGANRGTEGANRGASGADPTPVHLLPRHRRARRIALLEQESSSAVPLTVRDVVALGRIPYRSWWGTDTDPAAVDRALEAAEAAHLADRGWATLSGGERQRVQIARALAQEPALLLLDEPTNHLDVAAQLHLLAFVRGLGTTTVAALHDLNLAAAFCEHVLVLSAGRLAAAGHPADVLTPALLRQVYGVEAEVLTHPRTGRPVIAFTDRAPVAPGPAVREVAVPEAAEHGDTEPPAAHATQPTQEDR